MPQKTLELTFQQHIADSLARVHGYGVLDQSDITDTEHCIAEDHLWAFLRATQAKTPGAHRLSLIALSLLLGGAIGNTIDRIRMGEVIDFLDFYIGSYHWPAFNVADSAITIGVGLLMSLRV